VSTTGEWGVMDEEVLGFRGMLEERGVGVINRGTLTAIADACSRAPGRLPH
jgi:hypothetical protein